MTCGKISFEKVFFDNFIYKFISLRSKSSKNRSIYTKVLDIFVLLFWILNMIYILKKNSKNTLKYITYVGKAIFPWKNVFTWHIALRYLFNNLLFYFGQENKLGKWLKINHVFYVKMAREKHVKLDPVFQRVFTFIYIFLFQGLIKRRSLIKDGNRPIITIWRRYWMQLWGDAVVLYASKLFSQGETRDHFRNDPCKYVTIAGWHILVDANTLARDFTFQLTDPIRRNVYQFRTGKYVNL